jgi:hypothetical protein
MFSLFDARSYARLTFRLLVASGIATGGLSAGCASSPGESTSTQGTSFHDPDDAGSPDDADAGSTDWIEELQASPMVNPPTPLDIPTYDGSGQAVEPTVLEFPKPWNGHRFWMAMSPYPNADASLENPSIVVSDDGLAWSVPDGLVNPLAKPTPNESGHLDDATIVYDDGSDELWLYYLSDERGDADGSGTSDGNGSRPNGGPGEGSLGAGNRPEVDAGAAPPPNVETLWRMRSPDGVHWTSPESVLSGSPFPFVSPSVAKVGSTFLLWTVEVPEQGCFSTSTRVAERVSQDGVHWSEPLEVPMAPKGQFVWHLNVTTAAPRDGFLAALSVFPAHANCRTTSLYLGAGHGGADWRVLPKPIVRPGKLWDDGQIYRASLVYEASDDLMRVWYSARRQNTQDWHIGYAQEKLPVIR